MSYKFDMGKHSVAEQGMVKKARESKIVGKVYDDKQKRGDDENEKYSRFTLEDISLDKIVPRSINQYSQRRINSLAKSIENTGDRLIHPIVVARLEDFPKDHEIIRRFAERNEDLTGKEYVIVAGERRYRAFKKLREEREIANKNSKKQGLLNPFDTITANILTRAEIKKEQAFYEDSNVQARQLTPTEAILHVKTAFEEVQTPEQKLEALKEMYKDTPKADKLPKSAAEADEVFRMDEYVRYYLSQELGIEGWSASTIRTHLSIVRNCADEVVDSIIQGEVAPGAVRKFPSLSKDVQIDLLGYLKNADPSYKVRLNNAVREAEKLKEISPSKKTKKKSARTYRNLDVRKEFDKAYDKISDESEKLRLMISDLGKQEQSTLKCLVEELDLIAKKLKESKAEFK